MARILGVEIPDGKKTKISLTYIYGVGFANAARIVDAAGVDKEKKVKDLSGEELSKITAEIQNNHRVEGALRREVTNNIRQLIETGSYRGSRHKMNLPVRGQRTSSNARTRKGPKKTVGIVTKRQKERLGEKRK